MDEFDDLEMPQNLDEGIAFAQKHTIITIIIGAVYCCFYLCCLYCFGRCCYKRHTRRKKHYPNEGAAARRGIAMSKPKQKRMGPRGRQQQQPRRIPTNEPKERVPRKQKYPKSKDENSFKEQQAQQTLIPIKEKPLQANYAANTKHDILVKKPQNVKREKSKVDYGFLLQQQNQYNVDNDVPGPPVGPPPPTEYGDNQPNASANQNNLTDFTYQGGIGGGMPQQKFNF
eukprot:254548_1